MQSGQLESDDVRDRNEPDFPAAVPDIARAWESAPQVASSVRRPSTPPDPHSYHKAIEPQAIFELDERLEDGSIETIFVVPFACRRCKKQKQACSRLHPACVRCRKAGDFCTVDREGYQRISGPKLKLGKVSMTGKCSTSENSKARSLALQEPSASRSRAGRTVSGVGSLSQVPPPPSNSECHSIASGSKRSLSPGSEFVPPRKKTQARATSRNGKARCQTVEAPKKTYAERGVLKWTFVNNSGGQDERSTLVQTHTNSIPYNAPIPRVWTYSRDGLLTIFPELAKTPIGFSWFQSETPILLLDTDYIQGHWINPTTLSIDLLWDFSCYEFELEPTVDAEGSTQLHSRQHVVHFPGSAPDCGVDTMGSRHSYLSPGNGLLPLRVAVSTPQSTSSARTPPSDGTLRYTSEDTSVYHTREITSPTPNDLVSVVPSTRLHTYPQENLPSSHSRPPLDGSINQHTTFQATLQPRIPLNKPPEVEILLNSHPRDIPLLLWMPHDSKLVPCKLPPEYAYICMGLFSISDLRHVVIHHDSYTAGVVRGRVFWSVTLQWAPGGEDALFDHNSAPSAEATLDSTPVDTTRDLLRPWWFNPTDVLSQADGTTSGHRRDLRTRFFSLIPLDLLADFHPSESFPRGWFCKSCGMINIQELFRHQICRSATCGRMLEKCVPQGKVDSLSSLRDFYQSGTLVQPTSDIPEVVAFDTITWDDGMQSWVYRVRDGVTLRHIFTGNQECLQEDAIALLERIQSEILLRKEDPSSPYFTHTTRLSHPSDDSETMVPGGTPDCVRVAYYTLSDFVHRYGDMEVDRPRFGEVHIQAWVSSGSRKGSVFRASRSPVVIHCLGAEVVLNLTPKGGYEDAPGLTAPDKGKGRAQDKNQIVPLPMKPLAGPSPRLDQDKESTIIVEHLDDASAAMDTMPQCGGMDAGADSKTRPFDSKTEMARHKVAEPKQGSVRKKTKASKAKSKVAAPEISMTLVHGDCLILHGDDFECQIVRTGTTILVIGFPEDT